MLFPRHISWKYIYIMYTVGILMLNYWTDFSYASFILWCFSSANDDEDDNNAEFRECIRVLADKVSIIMQNRSELHDCFSRAEAARSHILKELDEKKELVQNLRVKLQLERQVWLHMLLVFLKCIDRIFYCDLCLTGEQGKNIIRSSGTPWTRRVRA